MPEARELFRATPNGMVERSEGAERVRTAARDFSEKVACLQVFRGEKPCYEIYLPSGCWLWLGALNSKGYPSRGTKAGGSYLVHRRVYEQAFGTIPAGHQIHHVCEQKRCVNPAHLETRAAKDHTRHHIPGGALADAFVEHARQQGSISRGQTIQIALDRGMSKNGAQTALRRSVEYGELERVGYGLYTLPSKAIAA